MAGQRGVDEATVALGMIHGRFQPFHNGHMAYMLGAAARCERLLVGITNPDRAHLHPTPEDPARHLPRSNPYTYTERLLMIRAAARDAGLTGVEMIPFPITTPELWPDYVPQETVHFVRVFSPWGAAKHDRLRAHGYRVWVLDEGADKQVSGAQVRAALRSGTDWRALVPAAIAEVLHSLPPAHALAPRPAA